MYKNTKKTLLNNIKENKINLLKMGQFSKVLLGIDNIHTVPTQTQREIYIVDDIFAKYSSRSHMCTLWLADGSTGGWHTYTKPLIFNKPNSESVYIV